MRWAILIVILLICFFLFYFSTGFVEMGEFGCQSVKEAYQLFPKEVCP
jgi:hypothetical protein